MARKKVSLSKCGKKFFAEVNLERGVFPMVVGCENNPIVLPFCSAVGIAENLFFFCKIHQVERTEKSFPSSAIWQFSPAFSWPAGSSKPQRKELKTASVYLQNERLEVKSDLSVGGIACQLD